jgi:hypothetical protein
MPWLQPRIISVDALPDYILRVTFATGEVKNFDVKPYIKGTFYGELADEAYFRSVRVIENGYTVGWPNEQDLAPHELYGLYDI